MNREEINELVMWSRLGAALMAAWWASVPLMQQVLLAMIALDIATGIGAAIVTHNLASDVSFRGLTRKALVVLLVCAAGLFEPLTGIPVGQALAAFYALGEAISVTENMTRAGVPLPVWLTKALAKAADTETLPPGPRIPPAGGAAA